MERRPDKDCWEPLGGGRTKSFALEINGGAYVQQWTSYDWRDNDNYGKKILTGQDKIT